MHTCCVHVILFNLLWPNFRSSHILCIIIPLNKTCIMYESQGPHPTVAVEVLQPAFQKQWCAQAIRNLGWPLRCRLDLGFNCFDKDEYKDILSIDMIKQVWIGMSSTFCFAHFWVVDTEDLLVEFLDMPSYFPFLSSPGWPFAHLILCRSKVGGEDVVGTWAALIAFFFFCLNAAWLNVSVVRAVALLSATNG